MAKKKEIREICRKTRQIGQHITAIACLVQDIEMILEPITSEEAKKVIEEIFKNFPKKRSKSNKI